MTCGWRNDSFAGTRSEAAVWPVKTLCLFSPLSSDDLFLSGPSLVNISTLIWRTVDGGRCSRTKDIRRRDLFQKIWVQKKFRGKRRPENEMMQRSAFFDKAPLPNSLLSVLCTGTFSRCMWPFTPPTLSPAQSRSHQGAAPGETVQQLFMRVNLKRVSKTPSIAFPLPSAPVCHLLPSDLLHNILRGSGVPSYRVRPASVNVSAWRSSLK